MIHPIYIDNTVKIHHCLQFWYIQDTLAQPSNYIHDQCLPLQFAEIVFLLSDALGLQGDSSILHRWVDSEGNFTYDELCPEDLKGPYPCKAEEDGKQVALMCGNLFRLDATVKYKEGFEHNLLQKNLKAQLVYFNSTSAKYSALGMFILTEFWAKGSNLGIISKLLHADSADHVQNVMDKT